MQVLRIQPSMDLQQKGSTLMNRRIATSVLWGTTTVALMAISVCAGDRRDLQLIALAQAQTAAKGSTVSAPATQSASTRATTNTGAVEQTVKAFQEQVTPPVEKPPVVVEFASAVRPGEHPGPGELVRSIRTFVHWTLVCDALTGKRQVCFLEQRVVAPDGTALTWQVAQTADGHVMIILKAPATISESTGLKLSFGGFERTEKALRCDASACISLMPFEGRVAEWMTSEPTVGFGFEANGRPYEFTMSMDGFKQAMDAIPRAVSVETAARAPEPEGAKTKVRTAAHRPAKDTGGLVPLGANGTKKDF